MYLLSLDNSYFFFGKFCYGWERIMPMYQSTILIFTDQSSFSSYVNKKIYSNHPIYKVERLKIIMIHVTISVFFTGLCVPSSCDT
jgi:hypothetical protein